MADQLPYTNKISQSTKHSIKENAKVVSYGDGFEQVAVIGLNQQRDRWNITYSVLDEAERLDVLNFYRDKGLHESFTWTAFGDTFEKKWRISGDYSESLLSGKHFKISFNITQVFDI